MGVANPPCFSRWEKDYEAPARKASEGASPARVQVSLNPAVGGGGVVRAGVRACVCVCVCVCVLLCWSVLVCVAFWESRTHTTLGTLEGTSLVYVRTARPARR